MLGVLALLPSAASALPPGECFMLLECRWQGYTVCVDGVCQPWQYDLICDLLALWCDFPAHEPVYPGDLPYPPAPPPQPWHTKRW